MGAMTEPEQSRPFGFDDVDGRADDPGHAGAWLLDLVAAVDHLSRGPRLGLTVWEALEEAVREYVAVEVSVRTGWDPQLGELAWDAPDPLRDALTHLLTRLDDRPAATALQAAIRRWVASQAQVFNDGFPWPHPRPAAAAGAGGVGRGGVGGSRRGGVRRRRTPGMRRPSLAALLGDDHRARACSQLSQRPRKPVVDVNTAELGRAVARPNEPAMVSVATPRPLSTLHVQAQRRAECGHTALAGQRDVTRRGDRRYQDPAGPARRLPG